MVSVAELSSKIADALDAKAREEGSLDLQHVVEPWAGTSMLNVSVFTNAFAGLTTGSRQGILLGWLSATLTQEEQSQIAMFHLQTQDELREWRAGKNLPSLGMILELDEKSA